MGFGEDSIQIGGAGGEMIMDGSELAAVGDELGTEFDEQFCGGSGTDGAAPGFTMTSAGGIDGGLHV